MTSEFHRRLAKLRRETTEGPSESGTPEEEAGLPDHLRSRLDRSGRVRRRRGPTKSPGAVGPGRGGPGKGSGRGGPGRGGPGFTGSHAPGTEPLARTTQGDPEGLRVHAPEGAERGGGGGHVFRATHLDGSTLHGAIPLDSALGIPGDTFARFTGDPGLASLDTSSAVYLDIETTGLSGGAGVLPYMVGLGTFREGSFEVWQGFLRTPGEEAEMLAECARRISRSSGVVSFFGKSFDRHRLEDKMRIHGIDPPFESRPHLDLYHPLRRIYRGCFPDNRLGTLERELCGVDRVDDLPGAYAPEAWFDYLAGRPHRLEAVFRHNYDDVLSLVVLAYHLGSSREPQDGEARSLLGPFEVRALAWARIEEEGGDPRRCLELCERVLGAEAPDPAPWTPGSGGGDPYRASAYELRAKAHARRDRALESARSWAQAVHEYRCLGGDFFRQELAALSALAKLQEHRLREIPEALDTTLSALERIGVNDARGPGRAEAWRGRARAEFERRRGRLERILGKGLPGGSDSAS